jgi:hypothetical protein
VPRASLEPLHKCLRLTWKGECASVRLLLSDTSGSHTKFRRVSQSPKLGDLLTPMMEDLHEMASGLFHLCQAWGLTDVSHRRNENGYSLVVELREYGPHQEFPHRAQVTTHLLAFPLVRLEVRFRDPAVAPPFYSWREVRDYLELRITEIWQELVLYQAWRMGLVPLSFREQTGDKQERVQRAAALADTWSRGSLPPLHPGRDRMLPTDALQWASRLWELPKGQVEEYLRFVQQREVSNP